MPLPRILVQNEMQTASFKVWTQFVVSISNENNRYTREASKENMYKDINKSITKA